MRTILFVLALALPVTAGPGSWTAFEHGESARSPADEGHTGGNATRVCVRTGPFVAFVSAFAITDPLSEDQAGSGSGRTTNWYSLGFSGSAEATEHRWRITTWIHGSGDGTADGVIDGTAWGEAVLAVAFTGDNGNVACGQLAVDDSGGAAVSLTVPPGLRLDLQKRARSKETDVFVVDSTVTTTGSGKVCRVRVETAADVGLGAGSCLGVASAHLVGVLHGELLMTGTCRLGDRRVEDRFGVEPVIRESVFDPPSGGVEQGELDPPDEPTEEEREGRLPGIMEPDEPDDAEDVTTPTDDDGETDPRPGEAE
jgi:hypothetical protein